MMRLFHFQTDNPSIPEVKIKVAFSSTGHVFCSRQGYFCSSFKKVIFFFFFFTIHIPGVSRGMFGPRSALDEAAAQHILAGK